MICGYSFLNFTDTLITMRFRKKCLYKKTSADNNIQLNAKNQHFFDIHSTRYTKSAFVFKSGR